MAISEAEQARDSESEVRSKATPKAPVTRRQFLSLLARGAGVLIGTVIISKLEPIQQVIQTASAVIAATPEKDVEYVALKRDITQRRLDEKLGINGKRYMAFPRGKGASSGRAYSAQSETTPNSQFTYYDSYNIDNLRAMPDGSLIGVATLADKRKFLVSGDIDQIGEFSLKALSQIPFNALDAVKLPDAGGVNGQTVNQLKSLAVGDKGEYTNIGTLGITSGLAWDVLPVGSGSPVYSVQAPRSDLAILRAGDPQAEGAPVYYKFNPQTRALNKWQLCDGCINGILQTSLVTNTDGKLEGWGPAYPNEGVVRLTIDDSNILTTQYLRGTNNPDNIHFIYKVKRFIDSGGSDHKWAINVDTWGSHPNSTNEAISTIFDLNNPIQFQAKQSLYSSGRIVTADLSSDKNFNVFLMANILQWTDSQARRDRNYPYIESIDPLNITDYSKRFLLTQQGDWFKQTDADWVQMTALNMVEGYNKKFAVASLEAWNLIYNSSTQELMPVFQKGAVLSLDITSGLSGTQNVWNLNTLQVPNKFRVFLTSVEVNR